MKKKQKLNNQERAMIGVIAILVIALSILIIYPNFRNKEKIYSIEVIRIEGCDECFNIDSVLNLVKKIENINIKNEKTVSYKSDEGKSLISKYDIKKIPALILISRKINEIETDETLFRKNGNSAIFDKAVPYVDLDSGEIKGFVNLKEVYDSKCIECANLSNLKGQLERLGIKVNNYERIDSSFETGKELIKENDITYLNALLITKEINEYWWIFEDIKTTLIENENYYKFSEPISPYKEISTGKIKGKIKLTYITNKSCEECFNVTSLKSVFENLGIYVDSEKYIDVSSAEGKDTLKAYNITAIPTAILSKEILDYDKIKKILEQVGSFEKDETFVLRKLDVLKVKYQSTGG